MNYVNRALVYQRAMCWNAWSKAYLRLPHGVKLFLVAIRSLTRSPEGFRGEWMLSAINPLMRVCERGVWWIGLLCFLVVVVGVSGVVVTCYSYVIPSLADSHPVVAVFWVVYGHYLLVNIVFHYYKGFLLGPGQPTKVEGFDPYTGVTPSGWNVCFKCCQPKPPRAHHCRICNRCTLKMDHHCPWFFNCIGQNNHRHFMLFVIFMWLGVIFVVQSFWRKIALLYEGQSPTFHSVMDYIGISQQDVQADGLRFSSSTEHFATVLVFFVCFGVSIALILLGGWHVYLISSGITSIEFYSNRSEMWAMKREGKKFVNPYHYGFVRNWKVFLGLDTGRSFWRHVILPSGHMPICDGMNWEQEFEASQKMLNGSRASPHPI